MRDVRGRWLVWALVGSALLFVAQAGLGAEAPWEQLRAYYDYDASMPLGAVTEAAEDRGALSVQTVHFESVNDETVPATLCRPRGEGKLPVVLFLHGAGMSRKDAATLVGPLLCPLGVAVLSIDAQYCGDRKMEGKGVFSSDVGTLVAAFRQSIIDNRRAIDYIVSRDDLDGERVVLVGASMGGMMGSVVAAVDKRVRGALLLVAGGDLVRLLGGSELTEARQIRERLRDLTAYAGELAFIDPANFAAHISPRRLAMLNGKNDQIVPPECGRALYDAAREPKEIVWFEGGASGGHIPPLAVTIQQLRSFLTSEGLLPTVGAATE